MKASLTSLASKLQEDPSSQLERLEFLVKSSPVVIYTCEPRGDFGATFVSAAVKTLWGYEPEEFLRESSFWVTRIHPDDAPRICDDLASLAGADHHSHEYRLRMKSGEYRWIHDEIRLVRDAAGNPLEMVGHCFDITERKVAEDALRESEARLALIFNSTSDLQALFRLEPGNRFITETVNQALAENLKACTGKDAANFVGMDFEILLAATGFTPEEIESRRSLYLKAMEGGAPLCFGSPGSPLRDAAEISLYPVRDQHGRCTHILWNGRIVSERVKAAAALRESEERYALVTQATNDGIYDWNLVTGQSYLSPRLKEILGYRDDELSSDPSTFFDRVHPDDSKMMNDLVARVDGDPAFSSWVDVLRLRCKDGSYRWVMSRGQAVRDVSGKPSRIIGSIRDITDKREAAAKLAAGEKRLRDILDSLFGFVGLYSLDGIAIELNRASLEAGGFEPEEVLGKPIWETPWCRQLPMEQAQLRGATMRAARGEVVRYEATVRVRDGRQMILDVTFSPLRDPDGVITNIIGFGVDITQRKQAEAEFRLAKQIAEAASQAKSEFLANMSHEIRTPMNGIIGLTEVVLDTELNEEQREYLSIVKTSAESLLAIISDILDISKLQAGKVILHPKEFWLRDLVDITIKGLTPAAEKKKLKLAAEVAPGLPDVLLGDAGCLRQVLANLVGNAIKFTAAGEVMVSVESSSEDAGCLHFTVRDTGIGVAADKQNSIFEPFTQVDGSRRREFGGTGLGLAISAQLVDMMGGRIWVESDGRTGSTFHFAVRMATAQAASDERRHWPRFTTDDSAWIETMGSSSSRLHEVRILDISKGGLKLRSAESLDPGTTVQVHLKDQVAEAEVRYCVPAGGEFLAGVRFVEI